MNTEVEGVLIRVEDLRVEADAARDLLMEVGLPSFFATVDSGRYGFTRVGLETLEAVERALAVTRETAKHLQAMILGAGEGFVRLPQLAPEERRFVNLFAAYVGCVEGAESVALLSDGAVRIENAFALGEILELLSCGPERLHERLLADLEAYLRFHRDHGEAGRRLDSADAIVRCLTAYFRLMQTTVAELARDVEVRRLLRVLEDAEVVILGRRFHGFEWRAEAVEAPESGLLDITVDDIVGNRDYLEACLRTARDVAGFDFESGSNPKTVNPVLFALGRPGCGKTVTAHAVGNYFLDYCRRRQVPAKFLSIRRTDWASSYQNASANALVRFFTEQVGAAEGVVAVYWPDIDTAFAARDNPRIRSEEKNILGACFGIFDGTLLARNGKWFMMTDANYLNMDEATISRITQEPFILRGADTAADVVRLLRHIKLRHHKGFMDLDDERWLAVATRCLELDLSGRAIDNISRRIVSEVESFAYPDEYFRANLQRRRQIIEQHSRHLDADAVLEIVERYGRFELESEERARRDRFESRVEEIVFNLSAQREAMGREPRFGPGRSPP